MPVNERGEGLPLGCNIPQSSGGLDRRNGRSVAPDRWGAPEIRETAKWFSLVMPIRREYSHEIAFMLFRVCFVACATDAYPSLQDEPVRRAGRIDRAIPNAHQTTRNPCHEPAHESRRLCSPLRVLPGLERDACRLRWWRCRSASARRGGIACTRSCARARAASCPSAGSRPCAGTGSCTRSRSRPSTGAGTGGHGARVVRRSDAACFCRLQWR